MQSISKVAMQMIFLFALACLWAASSDWKQHVMDSLESNQVNEAISVLTTKKQIDVSSKGGAHIQANGTDIDPAAS